MMHDYPKTAVRVAIAMPLGLSDNATDTLIRIRHFLDNLDKKSAARSVSKRE